MHVPRPPKIGKGTALMGAADASKLIWRHHERLFDPEQRPAAVSDLVWDASESAAQIAGYAAGAAGAMAALDAAVAGGTIVIGGTATAVAAPVVVGTAAGYVTVRLIKAARTRLQ